MNIRYYLGKICKFFGFCMKCGNRLNFTRYGTGVCPFCGKRW